MSFNVSYVFYVLVPVSKARSLWCWKYNRFLLQNFAPGQVQEVKKVEVIEQAVSWLSAEELLHFPKVYSYI